MISITSFGERSNDYETVVQYFRAHFLQVHRRNNENRRVLYTHFTSVVVSNRSELSISLVTYLIPPYRTRKLPSASSVMVRSVFSLTHRPITHLPCSSGLHFQRISPICSPCLTGHIPPREHQPTLFSNPEYSSLSFIVVTYSHSSGML